MMEKPKSSKKQKLHATMEITGTVVLEKKMLSSFHDAADELLGRKVAFQFITDAPNQGRDRVKKAYLEGWITGGYKVKFEWSEDLGVPLGFTITNLHHSEFYLKSLTLESVPGHGRVHFLCNSWVYPAECYTKERVFFSNQPYLPWETPAALAAYREEELESLRGNGKGKMEEWDRVYDFDIYNDLGEPEKGIDYVRPILGDSSEFPYPRRGRTGRPPSSSDPKCESRLPLYESLNIYVPRDEKFGSIKMSDFIAYALKSIFQFLAPEFKDLFDETRGEFDSFDDVMRLYDGGIKITEGSVLDRIREAIPFETIRELLRSDGEGAFKFPLPQIIQEDKTAWRSDEEFAREMLAGLNPIVISRLKEFPPVSHLDPEIYGDQSSKLTADHIKDGLEGMTVEEALEKNKLYILDHHDHMMPYLARINTTATKTYATRTILYLTKDGTLKPLAIELSLPYPQGHPGAVSSVYTPAKDGVQASIWQLAKCHVSVNDSGYHQLICHWLHTHATIEPFVIATHRQLSVMHPIHKLLHPHFKDTMNVNALARQTLINAGGFLEITVFPAKYSLEMSSLLYKNWVFTEQALPADLLKRGVAVEDSSCIHGIRLLIEDYPYAADGLEIWAAIRTWVNDYCTIYYKNDESVQNDVELQSWWKDVREKGHGDKKHEPWWPKMNTIKDLTDSCTIIIWVASALHAAVNFGQYPYGGYLPNRPSMSRRFIPEPGTPEYEELKSDPDKAFLKSITSQLQSILGISLVEVLSRHPEDEVFLGQRDSPEWTSDREAIKAFEKFGARLEKIEKKIVEMNNDGKLKNRFGPVKVPYTLLFPSSGTGITGKGIPNSISI